MYEDAEDTQVKCLPFLPLYVTLVLGRCLSSISLGVKKKCVCPVIPFVGLLGEKQIRVSANAPSGVPDS